MKKNCKICGSEFDAVKANKTCSKECSRVLRNKHIIAHDKRRQYALKKQVLTLLGRSCIKCGNSDIRVLQIDHINGGGTKEQKGRYRNRLIYFRHIVEVNGEGYQLLCANCNWIKKYENNEGYKISIV